MRPLNRWTALAVLLAAPSAGLAGVLSILTPWKQIPVNQVVAQRGGALEGPPFLSIAPGQLTGDDPELLWEALVAEVTRSQRGDYDGEALTIADGLHPDVIAVTQPESAAALISATEESIVEKDTVYFDRKVLREEGGRDVLVTQDCVISQVRTGLAVRAEAPDGTLLLGWKDDHAYKSELCEEGSGRRDRLEARVAAGELKSVEVLTTLNRRDLTRDLVDAFAPRWEKRELALMTEPQRDHRVDHRVAMDAAREHRFAEALSLWSAYETTASLHNQGVIQELHGHLDEAQQLYARAEAAGPGRAQELTLSAARSRLSARRAEIEALAPFQLQHTPPSPH
ncbi:MAG: hypothetical protein ACI8S6_001745 [Myxococcota bacterium]|jgi:hypothetical protein